MTFESYITYEEYVVLGGKVPEDAFPNVERKARRFLDRITFNRIPHLTTIPHIVKEVLAEFIDKIYFMETSENNSGSVVSAYSNGVESFSFRDDANRKFRRELMDIAVEWLPDYLVTRSVSFDVEEYLQSESNNPQ